MTGSTTCTAVDLILVGMTPPTFSALNAAEGPAVGSAGLLAAGQEVVRELVCCGRASGISLMGPDGLFKQLTKMIVESALDEEMSEHLGCDKGDTAGRNRGNSRNGKRSKTVLTGNAGPVTIEVPHGARTARSTRSS